MCSRTSFPRRRRLMAHRRDGGVGIPVSAAKSTGFSVSRQWRLPGSPPRLLRGCLAADPEHITESFFVGVVLVSDEDAGIVDHAPLALYGILEDQEADQDFFGFQCLFPIIIAFACREAWAVNGPLCRRHLARALSHSRRGVAPARGITGHQGAHSSRQERTCSSEPMDEQ